MAKETPCQTPGVVYGTQVYQHCIDIHVSLPRPLSLSAEQEKVLAVTIHNALEMALAPLFVGRPSDELGKLTADEWDEVSDTQRGGR